MPKPKGQTRAGPTRPTTDAVVDKKKKRYRAGTVALRQIRKYQKTAELLIPKAPFARLVRKSMVDAGIERISSGALEALQEATEAFIIDRMASAQKCTIHTKRITVQPKDVRLLKDILREKE